MGSHPALGACWSNSFVVQRGGASTGRGRASTGQCRLDPLVRHWPKTQVKPGYPIEWSGSPPTPPQLYGTRPANGFIANGKFRFRVQPCWPGLCLQRVAVQCHSRPMDLPCHNSVQSTVVSITVPYHVGTTWVHNQADEDRSGRPW